MNKLISIVLKAYFILNVVFFLTALLFATKILPGLEGSFSIPDHGPHPLLPVLVFIFESYLCLTLLYVTPFLILILFLRKINMTH